MKKLLVFMVMAVMAMGARAQFSKGTHYANASLSGLGISYAKGDFCFGISGEYGYYIAKNWMIGGMIGYHHHGGYNGFQMKPEFRYTFSDIGLNLGCGLQYEHAGSYRNYAQLCPQVGYTFFLNNKVSIETALYADFGLNEFEYGTNAGLKIGIGLYK